MSLTDSNRFTIEWMCPVIGLPWLGRAWLILALLWVGLGSVSGERFLTVSQARALLFPRADRFEAKTVLFSADEAKALEKRLGASLPNRGNRIWLAYSGTNCLGMLVVDHVLGKHELIDYAVGLDLHGAVVGVELLEYRESHGGDIRQTQWRKQFQGKTSRSPLRLHDEIYNISGATISCRNVTQGVRRVLATFELVFKPKLLPDRGGSLPESAGSTP